LLPKGRLRDAAKLRKNKEELMKRTGRNGLYLVAEVAIRRKLQTFTNKKPMKQGKGNGILLMANGFFLKIPRKAINKTQIITESIITRITITSQMCIKISSRIQGTKTIHRVAKDLSPTMSVKTRACLSLHTPTQVIMIWKSPRTILARITTIWA
jgi:hypothetical protein